MNCAKCGAEIEANSNFCMSCGAKIESGDTEKMPNNPVTTDNIGDGSSAVKAPVNITKIIGMVVGLFFITVGLIRVLNAGTSISPASFGGDFYTYTYQGIVAVSEILASIEVTLGWIVTAIGAAIEVSALRH